MIGKLKKLLKLSRTNAFGAFSAGSVINIPHRKMVRFFENPSQDLAAGEAVKIDKDEISGQIDGYLKNITKRFSPSAKNVEGGLYTGCTGIAYMFYHLSKNNYLAPHKSTYIDKAIEYLTPALQSPTSNPTSFLLGDAGTYALAAVLFKEKKHDQYNEVLTNYKKLYNMYMNPKFLPSGSDEFFVGRAGYLAGILWLQRELGKDIFTQKEIYAICDVIVNSGREYAYKHSTPCPLMYHYYNTEYLGAAHGVSFILQMLLTVPGFIHSSSGVSQDVKASVNYLLSLQTEEGNWPCCMEENGQKEHKLVHWCHGAPGMIYLMARAYLVYKDPIYLESCIRAAKIVWEKGLLRKGPGICHGIAGNAYVFLLMYRLTRDEKYLNRAKAFADFMNTDEFLKEARVPDNPESLYEGNAGTVCFLADLLVPEKAEFPFQDVFYE